MNEEIIDGDKSGSRINMASSILAGWNVFLLCLFLLVILFSIVISGFGGSVKFGSIAFYAEVTIAGLISAFAGYVLGKKIYRLLQRLSNVYRYIALVTLALITILMFPSTFNFNISQDTTSNIEQPK